MRSTFFRCCELGVQISKNVHKIPEMPGVWSWIWSIVIGWGLWNYPRWETHEYLWVSGNWCTQKPLVSGWFWGPRFRNQQIAHNSKYAWVLGTSFQSTMVWSHVGFGLGKSITVTQTEIYGFRLAKELHAGRLAGRRWAPRLLQEKFMWSGIRNWGFEDGISAIKP